MTDMITLAAASVRSGRGWISRGEDLVARVRQPRGGDLWAREVDGSWESMTGLVRDLRGDDPAAAPVPVAVELKRAVVQLMVDHLGQEVVTFEDLLRQVVVAGVAPASAPEAAAVLARARADMLVDRLDRLAAGGDGGRAGLLKRLGGRQAAGVGWCGPRSSCIPMKRSCWGR